MPRKQQTRQQLPFRSLVSLLMASTTCSTSTCKSYACSSCSAPLTPSSTDSLSQQAKQEDARSMVQRVPPPHLWYCSCIDGSPNRLQHGQGELGRSVSHPSLFSFKMTLTLDSALSLVLVASIAVHGQVARRPWQSSPTSVANSSSMGLC
jgi:hypothetical protein